MWDAPADPDRFDEAVAWFRERVPLAKGAWRQLEDEAREKAFTIAEVANVGLVEDVWTALERAVANGDTLDDFREAVGEKLQAAWGRKDPWRLETIFRTNVQQAYGAGRFAQMTDPAILERRPLWRFSAILDSRTSEICRPKHGTVKRADDPWWQENYPPLHFCCRSDVMALTQGEAMEYGGVTEAPADISAARGFGRTPRLGHWAGAWARSVVAEKDAKWAPLPGLPVPRDLAELPSHPTGELLPRELAVGPEEFGRLLRQAWGGDNIIVQDPIGNRVILSAELLRPHVGGTGDGRERFLGLAPDIVRAPSEIWLVPGRKTANGPVELRKRYLKRYVDERGRNVWIIGTWRKGGWSAVTLVEAENPKALERQRRGYRLWPKR